VSELAIHRSSSASGEFPAYWRTEELPIVEVHTRARLSRFAWFWIGISLSAALAVSAIYTQRASILPAYEFKARPIATNPEMRLVQPRGADFHASCRPLYSCFEKSRL
jgi:hypothetical protein